MIPKNTESCNTGLTSYTRRSFINKRICDFLRSFMDEYKTTFTLDLQITFRTDIKFILKKKYIKLKSRILSLLT